MNKNNNYNKLENLKIENSMSFDSVELECEE